MTATDSTGIVMTEAELLAAITQAAHLGGWLLYHTRDSRGSAAGFPDLVLLRGRQLIFAELKAAKGRLTDEQKGWLYALAEIAGNAEPPGIVDVDIWRPDNLDEVLWTLTRRE